MSTISCTCGSVALDLKGPPILTAECHCTSCRTAAERLKPEPPIVQPNGGTRFVLQRKDRANVLRGEGHLATFRLSPEAVTERIVATCCNAPMWVEFKSGHWISVYSARWPDGTAPVPELRTMTRDAPVALPDDLPNASTHTAGFMGKLLWAWARMGFRNPQVATVTRTLDA